jgi:hypothetical protein
MRWRRHLRLAGYVTLAVVCLPIAAALLCLLLLFLVCLVVLVAVCCGIVALVIGVRAWVVRSWNNLPRNRRAIGRARLALDAGLPGREARRWHVARRDRLKCFVRAELTQLTFPRTVWLCAVWDDSGQVDDLGTWQFHDGIGVRHAARAYDRSRAAGQPWPTDLGQLVESAPAAELPSAAKPGLRPHHGSVLIRRKDGFAFHALVVHLSRVFRPEDLEQAEVFDAECRRLHLRARPGPFPRIEVLAPFPPLPPEKTFVVRLRHHLMSRADEQTKERLRRMLPAELAEYGIEMYEVPSPQVTIG